MESIVFENHAEMTKRVDTTRVSLKKILEKLFADEQLYRQEHIHYVADLLTIHCTDQYLKGLTLDFLDFDIPCNATVVRPLALIPSRQHKITSAPITWYVNSIAQLASTEKNALVWNILVLKAALYLMALPEIQPELFKQSHSEHFNTVKRLFQRFRVANKVLSSEKDYKYKESYSLLWQTHLEDPTHSLNQFVEDLTDFNVSNKENDFENNLVSDLRVTFTYVLNNKAKIARANLDIQLQHEFLDEKEFILESSEIRKGEKSKANNIEKQLDDQDNRQILVNSTAVTPLALHSESTQSYILPLVAKHIQRKEHLLPYSNLFPNTTSISYLLNYLNNDYSINQNKVALILMLSFITGNKTQEWLHLQSKRVKSLNSRQKIHQLHGQYFLRSQFSIFENKAFAYQKALLNQTVYFDIPIPNSYIASLRRGEPVQEIEIQNYLKQLKSKLYIPKLSLIKISSLLHQTILQQTGNKQLADILTGIDANKSSSTSYCHHHIQTLQSRYISILQKLCDSFSFTYSNIAIDNEKNFGSRKAPRPHVVKELFSILKSQIFLQQQDDWIAIFNHYNIWMWHLLLLFTAARPVGEFPGFLNRFNLKRQIFMVADKEVGGREGYGRLIPLGDFVINEIHKFINFIKHFQIQILSSHPNIKDYIQQILDSKLPLLTLVFNDHCLPLRPSIVKSFHPDFGFDHENWHRHTARAFLSNKISEIEILALFGHEPMQQEAAHPYSSLSLSRYSKIAQILEDMKDYFNITGIELDVLIQ